MTGGTTGRVRVRALQTSGMALALMLSGPAFAQCSPDPTVANTPTTCSGTDSDGLRVTTFGTSVSVPSGATVSGGTQAAIEVALPSTNYGSASITAGGQVDGGNLPGISLLWQAPTSGFNFSISSLQLTVAAGGTIAGSNAIVVGRTGPGFGSASATIDNSGALTGTSGVALLSTAGGAFPSVTNRESGRIGAISGSVETLTNAGIIDGGTRSALETGTTYYGRYTNTGTITSGGSGATLALNGGTISNGWQITNTGPGTAITGQSLTITNDATGRIGTAGTVAINANGPLSLTNTGTINGNVVATSQAGFGSGNTIDSSAGTINGSVTFGAGDDTLVALWDGTGLVTGITGAIDMGSGTDTLRARFSADATVGRGLTLPAGFERLNLATDTGVTATLVDGFGTAGPITVSGGGTVVNRTALSGATQVLRADDFYSGGYSTIVNTGTITTTAGISGTAAVYLGFPVSSFENSGTVNATGDGLSSSARSSVNAASGSIIATGTAVSLSSSALTNAGLIRSTGGTGAILWGSNSTNSGRIEGAVAGVRISSSTLVNTGTIASTGTGAIVDYYGVLDNRAGGTINGGVAGASNFLFNATIVNAGTINGNVRLSGTASNGSYNSNRYFALAGGVLNGSLTLGASDTLVAELAGSSGNRIAGVTGTVTGSGSLLRYRVRTDSSATLGTPTGFAGVGYDLYDGATLTLTGSATQSATPYTPPLTLAGLGTVDINATITSSSQPAIQVTSLTIAPGETAPDGSTLAITSRGAITAVSPVGSTYGSSAVTLGSNSSFTNAGTITVTDRSPTIYTAAVAISGGKAVTNSGTITLDAATGISGAQSFTNSGSIVQASGGRAATGVSGAGALTNSGTIAVAGNAVQLTYNATLTNSGRITSTGTAAIGLAPFGSAYGTVITNQANGTIAGGAGQAIQIAGGTLSNAGTITGSVDLGYGGSGAGSGRAYADAVYIANGGTIAGDLRFGRGNDILVAIDDVTGVSGTIDAGDGNDLYVHARTTSGTVTLGALTAIGFEQESVRASGTGTTVTIAFASPVAGDLMVSGNGAIINTVSVNGAVRVGSSYSDPTATDTVLGAFTNTTSIANGFSGAVNSFANSGTIGAPVFPGQAVTLSQTAAFANSGTITGDSIFGAVSVSGTAPASLVNSGTITGGAQVSLTGNTTSGNTQLLTLAMTNSGTITGGYQGLSLSSSAYDSTQSTTVALTNSGTIEATGLSGLAISLLAGGSATGAGQSAVMLTNNGTIRANAGGQPIPADPYAGASVITGSRAAYGLFYQARPGESVQITNAAGGLIEAQGTLSSAVFGYGALTLVNAGTIRGGTGTTLATGDSLRFQVDGSTLAGAIQASGGNADRIVNTGTIIGSIDLGAGDDRIENRGRIEGNIALGAGNDSFLLGAGGVVIGTIDGGSGNNSFTVELNGDQTLPRLSLIGFQTLATTGNGALQFADAQRYTLLNANSDIAVMSGGSLNVNQLTFGNGNNRLTIAGGFTGSIDGGAGSDTIAVSGGTQAAPVAFGTVTAIEALAMTNGFATVSGNAAFGSVDMSNGRLVGLAGSTMTASQFLVRQGATFGSAGTVNGNVSIAGTLSPGASPGTMTVNGNVAIQSGSLSVFEITPTVSDRLVVNGQVMIANGATLQLAPTGTLRPGTSYDLITASGGISGSYATILKPGSLFGFVVQSANQIQLLGQFLDNPAFSAQVRRSIAYTNATLATLPAGSSILNALPALLAADGTSNPAAFAQLTPEAYASARQIGVDNALVLAATARGPAFAATGEEVRPYSFAQTLGGWHRLSADPAAGTSAARSQSYGLLGGIGIGNATWSAGAFGGYLNDRQQIAELGARTKLDGFVAGIHGRYLTPDGLGVTASVLYDGGTADTSRRLPGGSSANGRYDLHSWVSDLSVSYATEVADGWALRPRAGLTYVRTTRAGVVETGGSPFALTVARDRHVAGFADAGIGLARSESSNAAFRPFVTLGVRYQIEGTRTAARAGYAGGGLGLTALGAQRAEVVGAAAAGVGYRLTNGLDLFATAASQTGRDDHQESITAGVRLRF